MGPGLVMFLNEWQTFEISTTDYNIINAKQSEDRSHCSKHPLCIDLICNDKYSKIPCSLGNLEIYKDKIDIYTKSSKSS